jgi:formylglycine-generating enzyme required for sulfatase activity
MKRLLHGLGELALAAIISGGCSANGGTGHDLGDEPGTKNGPPSSSGGSATTMDAGSSPGADAGIDSGADGGIDSGVDSGSISGDSGTMAPPSCQAAGNGVTSCGASGESCCTSLAVPGGTYYRTYASSGSGPTGEADPATVSGFRLDKYEVTVGRFRQFVNAWNGGAGWLPAEGSGKHTHLNGGQGLVNAGFDAGVAYEPGWATSDNGNVAPTNANLACESQFPTWTTSAGNSENLPINCVNWWESYAFCTWDGGFLPSEAEWEYASAGGSQQLYYPWGSTDPGTINQYAIYDCYYPSGSGPCTGGAAPVGTATLGAGLWGQLDLAGNVNEWNVDWFASYADPCTDCAYLTAASYRVMRSGYFYNDPSYLLPPGRSDDPPAVRSVCIGFRCARAP